MADQGMLFVNPGRRSRRPFVPLIDAVYHAAIMILMAPMMILLVAASGIIACFEWVAGKLSRGGKTSGSIWP